MDLNRSAPPQRDSGSSAKIIQKPARSSSNSEEEVDHYHNFNRYETYRNSKSTYQNNKNNPRHCYADENRNPLASSTTAAMSMSMLNTNPFEVTQTKAIPMASNNPYKRINQAGYNANPTSYTTPNSSYPTPGPTGPSSHQVSEPSIYSSNTTIPAIQYNPMEFFSPTTPPNQTSCRPTSANSQSQHPPITSHHYATSSHQAQQLYLWDNLVSDGRALSYAKLVGLECCAVPEHYNMCSCDPEFLGGQRQELTLELVQHFKRMAWWGSGARQNPLEGDPRANVNVAGYDSQHNFLSGRQSGSQHSPPYGVQTGQYASQHPHDIPQHSTQPTTANAPTPPTPSHKGKGKSRNRSATTTTPRTPSHRDGKMRSWTTPWSKRTETEEQKREREFAKLEHKWRIERELAQKEKAKEKEKEEKLKAEIQREVEKRERRTAGNGTVAWWANTHW